MAKREQTESTDKKKRAEVPAVDYLDILGQCEKVAKVQSLALSDEDRLDTGLLCLNGILGGGITAGMYTFFGPEQSAKTTGAITLAGASVNQDVGLRMLWDAENSTGSSTDYVENIFKMQRVKADVETLFGVKKDGKYIIKPLVYYRDEGEAETFFNFMSALLRRLPLKRFEDNQWWLIYPKDKEHLARFGEQMDQRMSKLNDAIYLPAKSGALQAIVIIDSYPGLVPESMDEDDPNNSIAQAARELSKGITRIKGKLRSRRVALVGINQLRTNPMARFCFHYNALVVMADGRQEKIGDLVNGRVKDDVLSYNRETRKFEPKPIVGWYDNGPAEEWLSFTAIGGATTAGQTRFVCTAEHQLLLANGRKVSAGRVKEGDYLLGASQKKECGEVAKQIILGSVLGDGWFLRNEFPGIRVSFAHKLEHIEYVMYKHHYTDGSLYTSTSLATCEPPKNYEAWLEQVYVEARALHVGTRRYSFSPTLARLISLRGVAIWWMDDSGGTSIKTQSLGKENTLQLIAALNERLSLSLTLSEWWDQDERQCGVKFSEGDLEKIAPYVHPLFAYRLSRFEHCSWYKTLGCALEVNDKEGDKFTVPLLVTKVERTPVEALPPNRNGQEASRWKRKYDIEVADNHLYVVNGAVVSNSNPEYEPGGGAIKFFCFSGDTLLMTEQGLLTAEEAYHSKPKFFQGEAGQEKPTLYDKQGYSQLMTLHTSRGHQMTGKPGHHVKVMNPLTMQAEFKSLSSLRSTAWHAGDYVGVKVGGGPTENSFVKLDYVDYTNTKFNSEHEKLIFPTKMSNALAWLMGVLVGDGHARGNTVYLACTNKGVATQFVELVDRIFGVRASVSKKGAWVCSTALVSFLTYIGAGSKSSWQKEVPWAVRLSGKSCWLAFLAGLFDADFSCGSTTVSYLAVSSTLVNQVRVMALLLGFPIANGNSKEAWWAHGANARLEADGKHRTEKQVVKKHRLKCPSIVWYGQTARDLVLSLTPYSANTERMERLAEQGREDLTPVWRILPVQKFDEDSKAQGNSIRKALKLYQEITGKSLYRMDCWDDSWIEEALSQVPSRYRTSHEREKVTLGLRSLQEILQYSKKNSIIWDKVDTVTPSKGRGMTYDGNMPHTHTIVTSGVVSHNSDVRLRFFPRALSGVPFHPKGEGQFEKEPGINGGVDTYRYINVRAIKNKLSLPNRETWLRIWVEDQHGQAQGYDPVWDVFYALHLSGQVEGKRSALRLKPHGREPFKKTLTWLQFKQAVIGSKEQKKEVFEYLGMSKAVDLRSFLLGQMRKGVYEGLYVEAQQTNKKAEADDE